MSAWGVLVRVPDRPGAVERVLGLARRRAMSLDTDSITRGTDGRWSVLFRVMGDGSRLDHYVREFQELHDLEEVLPIRLDGSDGRDGVDA